MKYKNSKSLKDFIKKMDKEKNKTWSEIMSLYHTKKQDFITENEIRVMYALGYEPNSYKFSNEDSIKLKIENDLRRDTL